MRKDDPRDPVVRLLAFIREISPELFLDLGPGGVKPLFEHLVDQAIVITCPRCGTDVTTLKEGMSPPVPRRATPDC